MKMKQVRYMVSCLIIVFSIILLSGPLWSDSGTGKTEVADRQEALGQADDNAQERLSRIDFGNTYIIGQTIKSGAVYLLQRKKSEIKSMLKYREDYRNEILEGFMVGDVDDVEDQPEVKPEQGKKVSRTGKPGFPETGQYREKHDGVRMGRQ